MTASQYDYRDEIAEVSGIQSAYVPEVLCTAEFAAVWKQWLQARYDQYSETLTAKTRYLWLVFVAAEPNPVSVVETAINYPHNCRRKLVAADRWHDTVRKSQPPYAQRTSRAKRSDPTQRQDTVYFPRTRFNK